VAHQLRVALGGGSNPEDLVERLRTKLALKRCQRNHWTWKSNSELWNYNNSRSLDIYEFTKAMKDYMLGFSDSEIKSLYAYFDFDRSGSVHY